MVVSERGTAGGRSKQARVLATGQATERTAHIIDGLTDRDLETMPLDQLLALRAQVEQSKRG